MKSKLASKTLPMHWAGSAVPDLSNRELGFGSSDANEVARQFGWNLA